MVKAFVTDYKDTFSGAGLRVSAPARNVAKLVARWCTRKGLASAVATPHFVVHDRYLGLVARAGRDLARHKRAPGQTQLTSFFRKP